MCSFLPQPAATSRRNGFRKPLKTILKSPSWSTLQQMIRNSGQCSSSSDDEDETPHLQRAKSVGCPPSPKKSVRFADTHGLALAQVFNIREPERESSTSSLNSSRPRDRKGLLVKSLSLACSQPASTDGFLEKVRQKCVCLENVAIRGMCVMGTVRVANLEYEKSVAVRWTSNNWASFEDCEAWYVPGSSDGESDRFAFEIKVPNSVEAGQKIQFAIRFRPTGRDEYWDNNDCKNYSLECYAQWKKDIKDAWHDAGGAKGNIFGSPL